MAASESTKFQIKFKTADGTLLNIYATTQAELESSLTTLQDAATLISATSSALGASSAANVVRQAFNATTVSSPSQTTSVIEEGNCKHGKLVYRESKPGAAKSWKGWFCPSPQGTPDQCAPKFLR